MGSLTCSHKEQTLGAYLLCLRPGDPCPCCGTSMRDASPTVQRRGRSNGLVCSDCGCELSEVRLPFESAVHQALSPAA